MLPVLREGEIAIKHNHSSNQSYSKYTYMTNEIINTIEEEEGMVSNDTHLLLGEKLVT